MAADLRSRLVQQKGFILRVKSFIDNLEDKELSIEIVNDIQARFDLLPNVFNKCDKLFNDIAIAEGTSIDKEQDDFEKLYFSLYGKIQKIISQFSRENESYIDLSEVHSVSQSSSARFRQSRTERDSDNFYDGSARFRRSSTEREPDNLYNSGDRFRQSSTERDSDDLNDEARLRQSRMINDDKVPSGTRNEVSIGETVPTEGTISTGVPSGETISTEESSGGTGPIGETIRSQVPSEGTTSGKVPSEGTRDNAASSGGIVNCFTANSSRPCNECGSHSSSCGNGNAAFAQMYLPQVKLPEMTLPTFQGDFNLWVEFRDSFIALIDSNPNLPKVQKLHYLRSALSKEVLENIKALSISEQNYELAWQILCERYEKGHLIIDNHVENILDLPQMIKDSGKELRKFYNSIFNNIASLKSLGQPIQHWDSLLIPILVRKLDTTSRREWEKSRTHDAVKGMTHFLQFIKSRCEVLEKLEIRKIIASYPVNDKFKPKNGFKVKSKYLAHPATLTSLSCIICRGVHPHFKCPKIQKMKPDQIYGIIKDHKLCFNCLNKGHFTAKCSFPPCSICAKRHNKLLHKEAKTYDGIEKRKNATDSPVDKGNKKLKDEDSERD